MAITFSPRVALAGFDPAARWQMVPVKGERLLTLEGASGLVPRVGNPKILEVEQTVSGKTTLLKLKGGKAPGKTVVDWSDSARFPGSRRTDFTLEVDVKKERLVPTFFHYVVDFHRSTGRNIPELEKLLIIPANEILRPQANVTITKLRAETLVIEDDLGDVVTHKQWNAITKHHKKDAAFNVFFVWAFEPDDTPQEDGITAATERAQKSCIFQDIDLRRPAPEVLAHEVVHVLGHDGHSNDPNHLIAHGRIRTGRFIPRAHADLINQTDK